MQGLRSSLLHVLSGCFPGVSSLTRKYILIGLAGVILSFTAGTVFYAGSLSWNGTGDSLLHIDYSWQLAHGDLPAFWEGVKAPVPRSSRVQFVSQHPPLYYMMLAPINGPLIDGGNWKIAVAISRAITIGIGLLCVLALAWSGWVFGGKRKNLFVVALPGIAGSFTFFVRIAGDTYNDVLVVLCTTVALTLMALVIKNGITRRRMLLLALVCLAGMASRASFVSCLLVVMLGVYASYLLDTKKITKQKILTGLKYPLFLLAIVVVGIGWFYLRNYRLSGNWHRSGPQSWVATIQHRPYKSLNYVLGNTPLWTVLPRRMYGMIPMYIKGLFIYNCVLLIGASVAAAWYWSKNRSGRIFDVKNRKNTTLFALLALQMFLVFGEQITHAVGYGAISPRYLLPALLPISLVLTSGALVSSRLRGFGVICFVVTGWTYLVFETMYLQAGRRVVSFGTGWSNLSGALQKNGIPAAVLIVLIGLIACGVVMQAFSLWRLTEKTRKQA